MWWASGELEFRWDGNISVSPVLAPNYCESETYEDWWLISCDSKHSNLSMEEKAGGETAERFRPGLFRVVEAMFLCSCVWK